MICDLYSVFAPQGAFFVFGKERFPLRNFFKLLPKAIEKGGRVCYNNIVK